MLKEEQQSLISTDTNTLPHNSFFNTLHFYIKQPRLIDWIIVGVLISALITTMIFCF
jgi:hypothetical protein